MGLGFFFSHLKIHTWMQCVLIQSLCFFDSSVFTLYLEATARSHFLLLTGWSWSSFISEYYLRHSPPPPVLTLSSQCVFLSISSLPLLLSTVGVCRQHVIVSNLCLFCCHHHHHYHLVPVSDDRSVGQGWVTVITFSLEVFQVWSTLLPWSVVSFMILYIYSIKFGNILSNCCFVLFCFVFCRFPCPDIVAFFSLGITQTC